MHADVLEPQQGTDWCQHLCFTDAHYYGISTRTLGEGTVYYCICKSLCPMHSACLNVDTATMPTYLVPYTLEPLHLNVRGAV